MLRMKRAVPVVALSMLSVMVSAAAFAQTADEVIEKHLAALGGREALNKITSRTVTGTIALSTPAGEVTGTIQVFGKAPNKARSVIKVDLSQFGVGELVVDQRFDGTVGYVLDSMNGNRDITGSQLDNMRNSRFPTPFLDYKENGSKVEIVAAEKAGDRDAYVLQVTPKSGSPSKQYLDKETYMLLKTVTTVNVPQLGRDVEQTGEFADYRAVDGVKLAHTIKSTNAVQAFTITVTSVDHNKQIDDASFAKPGGN
jgi:outer membrane lipoprotein-sorting protein